MMCSPAEHTPLRLLAPDELHQLNSLVEQGVVKRYDGSVVRERLSDAVITEDLEYIFPIWDGVPVIQIFEQIETHQLAIHFEAAEPAAKETNLGGRLASKSSTTPEAS